METSKDMLEALKNIENSAKTIANRKKNRPFHKILKIKANVLLKSAVRDCAGSVTCRPINSDIFITHFISISWFGCAVWSFYKVLKELISWVPKR
jgi:hypothetical protein